MLASKPTAAEAAEVDARADRRRLGGILPYREKSAAAGNLKFQFANAISYPPRQLLVEILKKDIKLVHTECKLTSHMCGDCGYCVFQF